MSFFRRAVCLSDNQISILVQLCKVVIAAAMGGMLGIVISSTVVFGFMLIILTPIFNFYYALIFFLIGSVYTFKLF